MDVVEGDTALAGAQRLRHRESAGLVAHVGAVGQVVRAVRAREELEQERCLVVQPARDVEEGLVGGVQAPQLPGEQTQRLVPADRLVMGPAGSLHHGLGQPALLVQPVVGRAVELGDRVLAEELPGDAPRGGLVVDVLGAVLAVLVHVPLAGSGFGPRAAGAVDALGLVDVEQRQRGATRGRLAQGVLQRVGHRGQTRRPGLGRGDRQVVARVVLDTAAHDGVRLFSLPLGHSPHGWRVEYPLIRRAKSKRGIR